MMRRHLSGSRARLSMDEWKMAPDQKSVATALKVGDRVRTQAGVEGTIAVFSVDGISAFVLRVDQPLGEPLTRCLLIELTRIVSDAHS